MADVDDLWYRTDETGEKIPKDRCGKGKRWQARWRDPAGRSRRKAFKNKRPAERYAEKMEADKDRGTYIDPGAGKITVREYAEDWLSGLTTDASSKESTALRFRKQVVAHLGDVQLGRIAQRPSLVNNWLAERQKELSPNYCKQLYGMLSAMLTAAVDDELIGRNPCQATSVRPPKVHGERVRPWPTAQVEAVRAAIDAPWRAAVLLGGYQGLRQGEMLGLAVDDVDFLRRVIHVRRQVKIVGYRLVYGPPKGGKERDVPLPDQLGLALSAHVAAHPPAAATLPWKTPTGPARTAELLFTIDGQAVNRNRFNRAAWYPALKRAGVDRTGDDRTGFHALRHHAASVWLARGVDIKAVSEYLGHHDPGFTLRTYTHLMPSADERMRTAVDDALGSTSRAQDVLKDAGEP